MSGKPTDDHEIPPEYPVTDPPSWRPCAKWPYAVHAFVPPRYELVAFDLPPSRDNPSRIVGWEIYSGPTFHDLVAKGELGDLRLGEATLNTAMADATRAWRDLQSHIEEK
jgi:hypothetical protein